MNSVCPANPNYDNSISYRHKNVKANIINYLEINPNLDKLRAPNFIIETYTFALFCFRLGQSENNIQDAFDKNNTEFQRKE